MSTPKRVKWKGQYGYVIRGTEPCVPSKIDPGFSGRCLDVVAKLESANWGTCQNYDNCGMSAGILHHVARFPKNPSIKGPLHYLVKRLIGSGAAGFRCCRRLDDSLEGDGEPSSLTGEQAVVDFYQLFSDPKTFVAQVDFAASSLNIPDSLNEPEKEICAVVYFSMKTNAPAVARKRYTNSFDKALVERLAMTKYGNWPARYLRTRSAVLATGHWDRDMVKDSLPESF